MTRHSNSNGFSLVELMVAMAITMVIMAATLQLFKKSVETSTLLTQRTEMQSELRAAANQICRDLNQAGTGTSLGGFPIPSAATGGVNPVMILPINTITAATSNYTFTDGILYKVTPGNNVGPNTSRVTDVFAVTYIDPTLDTTGQQQWLRFPTTNIALNGSSMTMPAVAPNPPGDAFNPVLGDAAVGLNVGDVLMLQNALGTAVGVVTNFNSAARTITFGVDALGFNQTAPAVGNIKAIRGAGAAAPSTTISRVMMVTYFIQIVPGPDGNDSRLMRQIGARAPTPIAEHIEDLQLTYDVFDDTTGTLNTGLTDAATGAPPIPKPNQIRKINLILTARSPRRNPQGNYDRISFTTSIGPRNLSFHDRYK